MKQVIKIPSLGDAENTEVIEICVNPGDSVSSEDSIVVLESEKAAMDVPASQKGVIKKVLVKIGDEVKEGDDFLEIEISEEEIKEDDKDNEVQKNTQEDDRDEVEEIIEEKKVEEIIEQPKYESSASGIYAGPAVRKLAREFGIDLNQIIASGPRNRILKEDLHKFVKSKLEGSSTGIPKMPSIDFSEFGNVEEIDLTKFQKTSALNLQQSWITIPHVTQHDETSIDDLLNVRKSLMNKHKVKVSPLAFFAKGICKLLEEFPLFNASLDMNTMKVIKKDFINLGIAIDTPQGLIVPNIKSADKKSIREISDEIARLADLSKSRKIKVNDLKGSTFTISSLGSFGGKFFTPIINPPEVAILGISKSYDSVLLKDTKPVSTTNLPISLSYDHRIINGVEGVKFTTRFCEILSDVNYFEENF
ncbi:2-oxo acid dehydrogenase subunit E2 [Pseudomonadota bacterium]|nr:2-oxo acid dehydrogenase subunit E2 [Pseudomonadota bacterium]